jgi:hypothetical protein
MITVRGIRGTSHHQGEQSAGYPVTCSGLTKLWRDSVPGEIDLESRKPGGDLEGGKTGKG